ncbi:pyrF [Symbiodinium microadriaticum]|nr:pyrF [Symbiodinium microadriaticum]
MTENPKSSPIFLPLDTPDLDRALALAKATAPYLAGAKVGLEFYNAHGPQGLKKIVEQGAPVFADLKFHDIPNTVAGAVRSVVTAAAPFMLNVHASGGLAMMKAAKEAAEDAAAAAGVKPPVLIAVTVLTSLDEKDMGLVGMRGSPTQQVIRLAALTQEAGLDGVVCSPREIEAVRKTCGSDFITVVPGIRPDWSTTDDQKRITTPAKAMAAGASYLVVGRPISGANDPADAARRVMEEALSVAIKICGVKTREAIDAAVEHEVDYLGFNFYPPSPRFIAPKAAAKLVEGVPELIVKVGLLVDPTDEMLEVVTGAMPIDLIQLHGKESVDRVKEIADKFETPICKAIPIAGAADFDLAADYEDHVDLLLFDRKPPAQLASGEKPLPGGNGMTFDWKLVEGLDFGAAWMLSGGLTPQNVVEAIKMTNAEAVDVSSGVETKPGEKDPDLIAAFLDIVHGATDEDGIFEQSQ